MSTIKWVNLQRDAESFHNPLPYTDDYELLPDLFYIGKEQDHHVIFAPLVMRLYVIPQTVLSSISPLTFYPEARVALLESFLLASKKQISTLSPQVKIPKLSSHIRLLMTDACNLACTYCYGMGGRDNRQINLAHLSVLLKSLPSDTPLSVEFHGNGEPTLAFEQIKMAYEMIHSEFPATQFTLQSNGLFRDSVADWLIAHNVYTAFSIDGPDWIHNVQRPVHQKQRDGHEQVMARLHYFQKHSSLMGKASITTVTAFSLPHLPQIYDFLKQNGIRHMKINPLVKMGRATISEDPLHSVPDIHLFADHLATLSSQAFRDHILIDSDFLYSLHTHKPSQMRCGAITPTLTLDPEGNLLACSDAYYLSTPETNPFFWGDVKSGHLHINVVKQTHLRERTVGQMATCQNCLLIWNCSGGCLVENYAQNGDIYRPIANYCVARRHFAIQYLLSLASMHLDSKILGALP